VSFACQATEKKSCQSASLALKMPKEILQMKPPAPISQKKRSGVFLWSRLVAGIGVVCAILFPRFTLAVKNPPRESFPERALKVKKSLDQANPFADQSDLSPHQMQWGNWPNWQNWGNWANWNNWNNWRNW
jgi:hypothetical protein